MPSGGVSNKESNATLASRIYAYYKNTSNSIIESASNSLLYELLQIDDQLSDVYKSLFADLANTIKQFGNMSQSSGEPRIASKISEQTLLSTGTVVEYHNVDSNEYLPESHNGLGYMNLIAILTDVMSKTSTLRCDNAEREPAAVNILFIEEPEAHTHPQLQTFFIRHLKGLINQQRALAGSRRVSIQCILTTHSAHVVANTDFDELRYMMRKDSVEVIAKNLCDLNASYDKENDQVRATFKFIKQYVTTNRAEMFFADKLILFEGDTEQILLPSMMEKVDSHNPSGNRLISQEVSIVPVGAYAHIFLPLVEFLGIKTLVITDADFIGPSENDDHKSRNKACTYENLTGTSNSTIKHLLPNETCSAESTKELFRQTVVHQFSYDDSQWKEIEKGKLGLVFQTGTHIEGTTAEYFPRSFEDAFIAENRLFLADNIDSFASVSPNKRSEFKSIVDDSGDCSYRPLDLAKGISKKSSFAMDILLASPQYRETSGKDWRIPSYIERGLAWLAED